MKTVNCFFFFIFLLIMIPIRAQNHDVLDKLILEWQKAEHPGGAVAIVDNGQLVYSGAFGLASLEYNVPNTDETIFNIASVSKQFTAFSMVLLEQQGKLSLDDDVRKYIPELPNFGTKITIRHLIHHISGLRNFQNLLAMAGWREGDPMSNDDLLKFIKWQEALNFPVGSEYMYCNTGYNLMATIVERVSGKSFINWTRENIFEPLDMDHSVFRNDMTEVVTNTASSYDHTDNGKYIQPFPFWNYMGNGNLYTTVGDLGKWMINFQTHALGGKAAYETMIQRGVLTTGDTIPYAFGIIHGMYRGLKRLQHGGSIGGYRSSLAYFPDYNIGIVVLTNHSNGNPGGKLNDLADVYLADHLKPAQASNNNRRSFSRDPIKMDLKTMEKFIGEFFVDDVVVKLYVENGQLMAKPTGNPAFPLTPTSDSTFYVAPVNFDILFEKEPNGQVNKITVYMPNPNRGFRISENANSIQNMAQLVGTYYSPELRTSYAIAFENDGLVMKHPRHDTFTLTPIDENKLVGSLWIFQDMKVIRNGLGQVTGLKVSNGRVRNLWFSKQGI